MQIINEARAAVAATGNKSQGRRLSGEAGELVGRAALVLRQEGFSWTAVAEQVGVSAPSAKRWATRVGAQRPGAVALLPVRLVPEPPRSAAAPGGLTLTTRGWKAEGLSVRDLIAVLAASS